MNALHHAWTVIGTSAPLRAFRLHRHVLLAPGFFVLVLLLVGDATVRTAGADVRRPTATATGAVVHDGGVAFPGTDATYGTPHDGWVLHRGSALFTADGLLRVRFAADGTLTGWNGGFFAVNGDDGLTVAAVTTPVLVRVGSGSRTVPVGMQWTLSAAESGRSASGGDLTSVLHAHAPGPLSRTFLEEQRARLATVQSPWPGDDGAVPPPTLAGILAGDAAPFDAGRHARAQAVEMLRAAVQGGDAAAAAGLLEQGALPEGPEGQRVLAALLATEDMSLPLRSALLGRVTDRDLRLLLAAHPGLRNEGLLQFAGDGEDIRGLLLDLPLLDTQPEPLPALLRTRWQQELVSLVERAEDRSGALTAALRAVEQGVREQRERQFIGRAAEYRTAAEVLQSRFVAVMTPEQHAVLAAIVALATPPAPAPPQPAQDREPSAAPLTAEEIRQLQERVKAMLGSNGALFTKYTVMRVSSRRSVRVSDVVFATAQGDELFSFDVHPDTAMLSGILRAGKPSSFAVSVEQFAEWISR